MKIKYLYPSFKMKCLTLSYDDGVITDVTFIDKISKSGLKATFNLNSGLFGQIKFRDGYDNSRLTFEDCQYLYNPYEIASHSLYHFHLEEKDYDTVIEQVQDDIKNLHDDFNKDIIGFAYPYGKFNDTTIKALKDSNILYARTTKSTYNFELPKDLLRWDPTIHHADKDFKKIYNDFLKTDEEMALLYVWGHTYEFENTNSWDILDDFIKAMKDNDDIAYLTNAEAAKYISALKKVEVSKNEITNNSEVDIYLEVDGNKVKLIPNETYIAKGVI